MASDERRQEDVHSSDVDALIAESGEVAQQLVEAADPMSVYRKGISLLTLGMRNVGRSSDVGAIATPLYLIWGSLTDAIDAPSANPDPTEAAETMRRAASEWLSVPADPEARRKYFDQWMYHECGYQRPTESN